MMVAWSIPGPKGLPGLSGAGGAMPDGAIALPMPEDINRLDEIMWRDGIWQDRPLLPRPISTRRGFRLFGLPEGAAVAVFDRGREAVTYADIEALNGGRQVDLPSDGSFRIIVSAPLPWRASITTLERGAGSTELRNRAMARAREVAIANVNASSGQARARFLTDAPGQHTVYAAKRAEAVAFVADPTPNLSHYPFLRAEVGMLAGSMWQLAQLWLHLSDDSHAGLALIEAARRRALAAIATAPDYDAIDTIVTDFNQALSGLSI